MKQAAPAPPAPTVYILDANVFIEAAKKYYAFDLVPRFWDGLLEHGNIGRVCTIDRVADEIRAGQDELAAWVETRFSDYVRPCTEAGTLVRYAALMHWAQTGGFTDAAKSEFATATVADAWLVAYAGETGGTIVTHELFDATCRRRVKIPNACQHFGIRCVDVFTMIRTLGIRIGGG